MVDMLIQELFSKGETRVWDHYPTFEADKRVLKIMTNRLRSEHPWIKFTTKVDKNNITIKLDETL